jgi:hypothetical protein
MAEFTYGPGSESVHVQVLAPLVGASRWDQVVWGPASPPPAVGVWSGLAWQDVDCQITDAAWTWACQRDVGILSVSEAGSLDLQTFDPDRQLDPANVTGPFFRQVRPGTRIRVVGPNLPLTDEGMPEDLGPVWTGWVDEISYDVANQTGRLRCTDPIALMAQTSYRDQGLPNPLPNTLRARARRVLLDAGIDDKVGMLSEVEIDDDDPEVAPFVPPTGDPPKVWSIIQDAAADALSLAWIDAEGRLRFSDWGAFPVAPISLGCGPAEEAATKWVDYLTSIEFEQNAEGIRNSVVAKAGGVDTYPMQDRQSIFTYGVREYKVDREVPFRVEWAQQILDDRADASLTVNALESRPADAAELSRLLQFLRDGPAQTRLRDDQHPPLIDLEVTVIGLGVEVSPDGWVFRLITSLSRGAFDALEPPQPSGVINIISEADGIPGDPSGAITLPTTPIPGNVLLLWHVVDTDFGPTPPGFIAHPSGPVNTGGHGGAGLGLALVQSKVGVFDGGAATTLTFDTAPVAGHLLVAILSERGNAGAPRSLSGWTAGPDFGMASGPSTPLGDHETLWHRAAPGGAVTVTPTGATNHRRMVIMEFSGPAAFAGSRVQVPYAAASVHPVPALDVGDWSQLLVGYTAAGDTGGGRHTVLTNDPAFTLIDQGEMQGSFSPTHIVGYRIVPPGSYGYSVTSDQAAFGGVRWAGSLAVFKSTLPEPPPGGRGQWFWRRVQPGDGPTVNGIRDLAGKVGLAHLMELENVVNVFSGPSASGDPTSPYSIVVPQENGGRVMGGIVLAFDGSDGDPLDDDALAPLAKNVEDWEDEIPFGPTGSVFFLDSNVPGNPVLGESIR